MNYLLSNYEVLPGVIILGSYFIIMTTYLYIYAYRLNKNKTDGDEEAERKEKIEFTIKMVLFFIGVLCFSILPFKVHDYICDGKIFDLFVTKQEEETRVSIWFRREHSDSWIPMLTHRFKSYNIETGKSIRRLHVTRFTKYNSNWTYYMDESRRMWVNNDTDGIQLIDVFTPRLIASEEQILKRNPCLGSSIKSVYGKRDYIFNPRTHGLKVFNSRGEIYEIQPNLKAIPIKELNKLPAFQRPERPNRKNFMKWVKDNNPGNTTYTVRGYGYKPAKNALQFQDPVIISRERYETKCIDKCWVEELTKNGEIILFYIDKYGNEINQIEFKKLFKETDFRTYAVTLYRDEMHLFVSRDRLTLKALVTDAEKGKLLRTINYFN